MVFRELEVVKVPRDDVIRDKSPHFPELHIAGLRLDMLEFEKKKRPGLPNIPVVFEPSHVSLDDEKESVASKRDSGSVASRSTISTGSRRSVKSASSSSSGGVSSVSSKSSKRSDEGKSLSHIIGEDEDEDDAESQSPSLPPPISKSRRAASRNHKNRRVGKSSRKRRSLDESDIESGSEEESESGSEESDDGIDEDEENSEEGSEESDEESEGGSSSGSSGSSQSRNKKKKEPLGAPPVGDPQSYKTQAEIEFEKKKDALGRWSTLRYRYPETCTEEFNEHSDFHVITSTYERKLKEMYLRDCITQYRRYLIVAMYVLELFFTKVVGLDMSGFAASQRVEQDKYDQLLFELGEKSYMRWGSNLPVEVRLILMVLMQGLMFYISKMVGSHIEGEIKNGGGGITDVISKMFMGGATTPSPPPGFVTQPQMRSSTVVTSPGERPKMRGPSISAKDAEPPKVRHPTSTEVSRARMEREDEVNDVEDD